MFSMEDEKDDQKESKLNVPQTFLIGLGFMSCMLAWGMYNFYIPRVLAGHYIEQQAYRVGYFQGDARLFWANFVMTIDNIAAILLQPYFGELSDRLRSKYGRRTPFLLLGIPGAAASLFLMPFVALLPSYAFMFISFMGVIVTFNLAMSFYRAPVVSLMPDLTPSRHRSMANVIINIMGGVGTAIGFMIPSLVGQIPIIENNVEGYSTFNQQNFLALDMGVFWATGIFMLIVLTLYVIFVKEKPTGENFWKVGERRIEYDPDTLEIVPPSETDKERAKIAEKEYSTVKEIRAIFKKSEKSAAYMFLAIMFWAACEDAFNTNLSLWGSEYARLPDTILGSLSLVMSAFVMVLGYPGAKLSNKKGRLWTLRTGLLLLVMCYASLIVFQEVVRGDNFSLGVVLIMLALGLRASGGALIAIAAITVIWQLSPKDKTGTYTGLYYVFKQIGSVLSPLIIGGVLSLFTPVLGTTGTWVLLNPYCFVIALLGYLMMRKVKRGEVGDDLTEEEIKELEELYERDDD